MAQIRVVLEGGRADVPEHLRVSEVTALAEEVKLPFYDGYEHFVFGGHSQIADGEPMAVLAWAGRTKVTE
jgi:hypothetical protein